MTIDGRRRALTTIVTAWLVAGTLDVAAACTYYPLTTNVKAIAILQGIASGLLGRRAFSGGFGTAMLGLALHYLIALIWTIIFFVLARPLRRAIPNRFLLGMVYGVVVWIVMNLVVVPMSRIGPRPFNLRGAVIGAVILMFCIGLPISMIVGRYRFNDSK